MRVMTLHIVGNFFGLKGDLIKVLSQQQSTHAIHSNHFWLDQVWYLYH